MHIPIKQIRWKHNIDTYTNLSDAIAWEIIASASRKRFAKGVWCMHFQGHRKGLGASRCKTRRAGYGACMACLSYGRVAFSKQNKTKPVFSLVLHWSCSVPNSASFLSVSSRKCNGNPIVFFRRLNHVFYTAASTHPARPAFSRAPIVSLLTIASHHACAIFLLARYNISLLFIRLYCNLGTASTKAHAHLHN